MPSNAAGKVCPKRSKRHLRNRRKKSKKRKDCEPAAQAAPSAVSGEAPRCVSPAGMCRVCGDAGLFWWLATPDSPAILRYCECSIGTERVAKMLDAVLDLHIDEKDRFRACCYEVSRI